MKLPLGQFTEHLEGARVGDGRGEPGARFTRVLSAAWKAGTQRHAAVQDMHDGGGGGEERRDDGVEQGAVVVAQGALARQRCGGKLGSGAWVAKASPHK